tara:strand:+ start:379 stop:990 length:612 start_codon:yes stop_codon:yes gene_type:complete
MWTQEIINVVVENKNRNTFDEKTAWTHDELNVIVHFVERYRWAAVEMTPEQYEAIEETSYDPDTYDTIYNSGSRYEIKDSKGKLFSDGLTAIEVDYCGAQTTPSEGSSSPDDKTAEAMSNFTWFEENYRVGNDDVAALHAALSENGWTFLGRLYAVDGDIEVMRKAEYDYLWTPEVEPNDPGGAVHEALYADRIRYLNDQKES